MGGAMDYKEKIISQFAERHCERICRATIKALQKITDCNLSGDDSVLKNTWDEICVQMQSEESYAWDAYVQTITATIAFEVERLPRPEQEAIWLRTPQGVDWAIDLEDEPAAVAICLDDITQYILHDFVLSKAGNYHNQRIEKYLDQGYELD